MGMGDQFGGLGNAIGSFVGYETTGANREQAQRDYEAALQQFLSAKATDQGPSAFNTLSIDPQDRANQLAALAKLKEIYSAGGLDPTTRAQLAQVQESNALQGRAAAGRVENEMAQRGLSSSGANFGGQAAAAQAAAQGNHTEGLQALALGRAQQMAALGQAGALSSGIRGQDYGQAADRAAANDAISRFNAENQTAFTKWRGSGAAGAYDAMAGDQKDQGKQQQSFDAGVGQGAGSYLGGNMDQGMAMAGGNPFSGFMGGGKGAGSAYVAPSYYASPPTPGEDDVKPATPF